MNQFVSLMYHNVFDTDAAFRRLSPSITSYFVDARTFAGQMAQLSQHAKCLDFETMAGLYDHDRDSSGTRNAERGTRNAAMAAQRSAFHVAHPVRRFVQITFDDGWLGSVEMAGPILDRHNLQALLFVTTDLIDRPLFVSGGQLQRLPAETFRIGSHARTHRLLNNLSEAEIREELETSKHRLEDLLGYEVAAVSIPGGAIDDRVRRIAGEAGYRYLFTSEVHINNAATGCGQIGRVPIRRTTSRRDFSRYLRHCLGREQWRRRLLGIPKRVLGGERYRQLRRVLLGETGDQQEMPALAQVTSNVDGIENTALFHG